MEKAYLKKDEKLRSLIGAICVSTEKEQAIWIGSENCKTLYINKSFEKVSGYTLKEMEEKNFSSLFHEKILLCKSAPYAQHKATLIHKKGHEVPLQLTSFQTKNDYIVVTFKNLNKDIRLSKQIRLSEQIIQNSNEAIIITDSKGNIKLWNKGATKIFKYKQSEVIDKPINLLSIDENSEKSIKNIQKTVEKKGFVYNIEVKRRRKNGEEVDLSLTVKKVTDNENNIIGNVLIYHDISQEKKNSIELQRHFETMQDAYKELGIQKRQIDYLYEIANAGCSSDSPESLKKLIVSAISMLTKCDSAILRLYDEKTNTLKLQECLGVNEQWQNKNQIKFTNSLAEEACAKKRPIIINNVSSSTKHQSTKLLKLHNSKTLILIPLIIGSKIIGSLSIYSNGQNKFRFIESDLLEKFACQASLALFAKSSLYQKELFK